MCCRFLRLCVRHIWPGPSGNDWFTSLLSSPSNTFLSHFNLGAAQQAANSTHIRTHTYTHMCTRTHMWAHALGRRHTHTRSTLATVGVNFLLLHFQPLSSKGWALVHPFLSVLLFFSFFFPSPFLSVLSLRQCFVDSRKPLNHPWHKLPFQAWSGFCGISTVWWIEALGKTFLWICIVLVCLIRDAKSGQMISQSVRALKKNKNGDRRS